MLKVATVCTGIGSPEYALRELGIPHQIVFGCDIDRFARETYLANFKPDMMFEDMTKPDILDHYADLFLGGIPCQSFSLAGKRLGELDPRGLLFYNFYEYVKVQKPKYFIIENVKGLLSDQDGKTFQSWLDLLGQSVNNQHNMFTHDDSLMYNLHWNVLNTKDFGLPQNRERVFIIGIRNDLPNNFRFPVGFPLTIRLKDILETNVDEKYYLSDKMVEYMNNRSANFNNGKINYKYGDDIASTITRSSSSLDISDNIIVEEKQNQMDRLLERTGVDISGVTEPTALDVYNKVLKTDGISPTLTEPHHNNSLRLVEPFCVAMRGRNPEKPNDRTSGLKTEQRLEPNSQGITNTITSVQKDNLIVEPAILTPKRTEFGKETRKKYEAGELKLNRSEITKLEPRTDGISNTITSVQKDNLLFEPYIVQKHQDWRQKGDDLREFHELAPTLRSNMGDNHPLVVSHRIRKLTPRECGRLQGFADDFKQPVSDTQAFKQFGNTISTPVIKAILKNLLTPK